MAKSHKSLRGQLLLDGGRLQGSVFHRSVVLVCQHDPKGAFGLVLNQPTDKKLVDVLDTDLPENLGECGLFTGGPVQPSAMSFLHGDPNMAAGNVLENLSLGHDLAELVALGNSCLVENIRVFAGYAGWAPGQLDDEIQRESWLVHLATMELVFRQPPAELWRHILKIKGDWQSRLLADSPEDPTWN